MARRSNHEFPRRVGSREQRMLKARREGVRATLLGLGNFGVIGWTVAVPAVAGALLGMWLDARGSGPHSWTLMFFVIGLAAGAFGAWRWVSRQRRNIVRGSRDDEH